MVEYALPFLALSVSLLWRSELQQHGRRLKMSLAALTLITGMGVMHNVGETKEVILQTTSPSNAYAPASEILKQHSGVIGNLFQGDFALILWAHPKAQCLQGLNHYFTHHDKEIAAGLEQLKRGGNQDAMLQASMKLVQRDVTLFTQRSRKDGSLRAFGTFAEANPELFLRVHGGPGAFARIWLYQGPVPAPLND
tara:strand:- start:11 stop:595 length:585 start_codon:yes stop_codon:yes gene_type:complete